MILVIAWSVVNILVDYIGQGGKIWLHMKYPTGVEDPKQLELTLQYSRGENSYCLRVVKTVPSEGVLLHVLIFLQKELH